VAFSTVLSVVHGGHEDTGTAILGRALASEPLNLAIAIHLVVLQNSQLGLLHLVLDLLRSGVDLLLPLLATAAQTQDEVEGRFLLNIIIGECATVFELLAGEDQALLVRGDAFLVLDFALDIVDRIGRLHLEGDSLTREGLDEDLHD